MNTNQKIVNQLIDNIEFVRKIEVLMDKVEIKGNNERDMLLAGFSRNLLSHFISINFLTGKKFCICIRASSF